MVPAILVDNKVVTGCHHGDAFGKLSETQKNADDLISGFADENKFITDDKVIYLKEIILIRHAEADTQYMNGAITDAGRTHAAKTAAFILDMHLPSFTIMSSPYLRCIQTAKIISEQCRIPFSPKDELAKQRDKEPLPEFEKRITNVMDTLPKKSIIVTHTDFIQNILRITQFTRENVKFVPNCSITYIFYNRLIWMLKDVDNQ